MRLIAAAASAEDAADTGHLSIRQNQQIDKEHSVASQNSPPPGTLIAFNQKSLPSVTSNDRLTCKTGIADTGRR